MLGLRNLKNHSSGGGVMGGNQSISHEGERHRHTSNLNANVQSPPKVITDTINTEDDEVSIPQQQSRNASSNDAGEMFLGKKLLSQ